MDDFYIFLKKDRNFLLKIIHFTISLTSFIFLIITSTIDSVIIALAIPGTVLNSALLLGLYCINERHDITDIEILITYGVMNLLAAMVFVNKTLQTDTSIFRMLFLNSYTVNIILCLCSGLLMLGEGVYRLIVVLVRNIYNNIQKSQNSQNSNILYNAREPNISAIHKNTDHDVDCSTNTSPSLSNYKTKVLTSAEKNTNTNPYEDVLIGRNKSQSPSIHPDEMISNSAKDYTDCSHYKLNSEKDEHRSMDTNINSDNGYVSNDETTGNDIKSEVQGNKESHTNEEVMPQVVKKVDKPLTTEEPISRVQNYLYPKSHTRHTKNLHSASYNENGLPVFVDRYGKRYIASLAGGMQNHLYAANASSRGYDTSIGDGKKNSATPIKEYYTNRKYSNSKVTITPSKDEVIYDSSDLKAAQDSNVENTNNNIRVAINEHIDNITKNKIKSADSNDFITNYNKYLAHIYRNKNSNNGKKTFNYKFYNHNYDYQWVCEA